jgi:hypothetical protein
VLSSTKTGEAIKWAEQHLLEQTQFRDVLLTYGTYAQDWFVYEKCSYITRKEAMRRNNNCPGPFAVKTIEAECISYAVKR